MLKLRSIIVFACVLVVFITTGNCAMAQVKNQQRIDITTNDGTNIQGVLVKQGKKKVVISISGINTTFYRSDINSIKKLPSLEQVYKQRRKKLKDDDAQGHYRLVYFLYTHKAYSFALKELNSLEKKFPDNERIKALREIIINRNSTTQPAASEPARKTLRPASLPTTRPTTTPNSKPTKKLPVSLNNRLSQKQINRIKVYEIDLTKKPLVKIPHHTIVTFFRKYIDSTDNPSTYQSRRDFRQLPGYQQLSKFFNYRAKDLYGQVEVAGDPSALNTFHRRIQTSYVTNYCGTTKCHGGFKAPGGLYLFNTAPGNTQTTYSDFYILNHYQNKDGKMINRHNPKRSLLVQYGMPRKIARTPHPKVDGWHPRISSRRSAIYKVLLDFLGQLYRPAPDYGIDYKIPLPKDKPEKDSGKKNRPQNLSTTQPDK